MFVVDTNVLIYAADRDAAEHGACRALVERCQSQSAPWYLTWGIVYEFLRVTTHPAIFLDWPATSSSTSTPPC